jgi:hypothetical protein
MGREGEGLFRFLRAINLIYVDIKQMKMKRKMCECDEEIEVDFLYLFHSFTRSLKHKQNTEKFDPV